MIAYFCCAGSGTSLVYAEAIKAVVKDNEKIYVDSISNITRKLARSELKEYDIMFAHRTGLSGTEAFFREHNFKDLVDFVYMMPQVAFNLKAFKQYLDPYNIPVRAMTPKELTEILLDKNKTEGIFKELFEKYNLECIV
ncbi:hypothetical protein [uncultured Clostridium sp.]|uniref:hypothetical protein n=1 Tax=uncultured Clostridium sp. TaxID=59620 RepID=UPI0025F9FE6A|nr:hypothetical protein [uncultured Clostridium sp.]